MSSIDDDVGVDVGMISKDCEGSLESVVCAVTTNRSAESAMKDLMVPEQCGVYDTMSKNGDENTKRHDT